MKRRSTAALAAVLLAATFAAARPAAAGCRLVSCGFIVAGNSAFNVVGAHEMKGGRWIVEAAPGIWTMKTGGSGQAQPEIKPRGWSGAVSVKRELSSRWAVGVLGSVARQTGTSTLDVAPDLAIYDADVSIPGVTGGTGFPGGTIKDIRGEMIGGMVTYDFFPNPEGFRLPFTLGVAQVHEALLYEHSFTNPNSGLAQRERIEVDRRAIGAFANVSFDFLPHKDVRLMPGFYLAHGSSLFPNVKYEATQSGATRTFTQDVSATSVSPVIYLSALYRPWGLSYDWNMTQLLLGGKVPANSIYSLKLTKRFGGEG